MNMNACISVSELENLHKTIGVSQWREEQAQEEARKSLVAVIDNIISRIRDRDDKKSYEIMPVTGQPGAFRVRCKLEEESGVTAAIVVFELLCKVRERHYAYVRYDIELIPARVDDSGARNVLLRPDAVDAAEDIDRVLVIDIPVKDGEIVPGVNRYTAVIRMDEGGWQESCVLDRDGKYEEAVLVRSIVMAGREVRIYDMNNITPVVIDRSRVEAWYEYRGFTVMGITIQGVPSWIKAYDVSVEGKD